MLIRTILVFAVVFSITAHADTFDVQIGAFRDASKVNFSVPAYLGELRSTSGTDGLTRYVVGPFASRAEASKARDRLRAAGFAGAFVRSASDARGATVQGTVTNEATAPGPSDQVRISLDQAEEIERLQNGDGQIVYLDGKLHRKVGDRFVPVRD